MFTLIAALLHLGNTAYFFDATSPEAAQLTDSGVQNLTWVAYLLQVDAATLMQSVLYRENVINGEVFAVPLTLAQVIVLIILLIIMFIYVHLQLIFVVLIEFTAPTGLSLSLWFLYLRTGTRRGGCFGSSAVRASIRLVGSSP